MSNTRPLHRTAAADDAQAGSMGLSFAKAVRRYTTPGAVLAALRAERRADLESTARGAGISKESLTRYERGEDVPTLSELSKLAKHLGADIRRMLELFGHVKDDAAADSMGIAAKFDGQLTAEEKAELRELVRLAAAKKRPGDG